MMGLFSGCGNHSTKFVVDLLPTTAAWQCLCPSKMHSTSRSVLTGPQLWHVVASADCCWHQLSIYQLLVSTCGKVGLAPKPGFARTAQDIARVRHRCFLVIVVRTQQAHCPDAARTGHMRVDGGGRGEARPRSLCSWRCERARFRRLAMESNTHSGPRMPSASKSRRVPT